MIAQNGIIEGFEPTFRSIRRDCDRYADALVQLIEAETINPQDYIRLNGTGSLWIVCQYIEHGHLDLVEAHVKAEVTSRDFYGPLFENTQAILNHLLDQSEQDRVFSLYRAAITHRLKALKAEAEIQFRSHPQSHAWKAAEQWVETYLPTTTQMIEDYQSLLADTHRFDPEAQAFEQSIQGIIFQGNGP